MTDQVVNIKLRLSADGVQQVEGSLGRINKLKSDLEKMSPAKKAGFGNEDYTQASGVIGKTGASARNFAAESQGLGGLVRLYATYAANLFAVTAAFKALSDAMDTTNMVQGLNQLSAASGQSLGSLSKQFAAASGGAISFREAMEATTKGSAAGLNSQQLLQLGDVAKKASQALGINMPDAVSRLTRGISKLEPELLDELGLFTKVGKATEDYARKVGKSVDSLTDFERRQAFANAVLKEGIDKFNQIDIPTNPYDKLLASLKNMGQGILEVINKYLTPLVALLSNSPTALGIGIALVAKTIVGQAIPAFRQYREWLQKYSEDAQKVAESRLATAQAASKARQAEIKALADAKAEVKTQAVDAAANALRDAQSGRIRKDVRAILDKTPLEVSDKELAKLNKLGDSLKNTDNVYKRLAVSISEAKQANLDYINLTNKQAEDAKRGPSRFSAEGIAAIRAEAARREAASKGIISSAGKLTAEEGFGVAMSKTFDAIKTEKLGMVRGLLTGIAAGAVAAGTALAGFAAALNTVFLVIGVLVAVYMALDSAFSNNSKQVGILEDKLSGLEETTKTAIDTNRRYANELSANKLIAQADAFANIADSVKGVTQAFKDAQAASSWWDRFTDSIAGIFGKSLSDKLANQLASSITASLNVLSNPELKTATEQQINELLGIKNIGEAREALKKLENSPEYDKVNEALNKILQTAKDRSQELALPLRAVKDGFEQVQKSYDEFSNSLMNRDPFTKWGLDLMRQTSNLSNAFQDSNNRLAVLNDLLKDTSKLNAFPPETRAGLLQAAKDAQGLNEELEQAKKLMTINEGGAEGAAKEAIIKLKVEGEERFRIATEKLQSINTNLTSGLNAAMVQGFKLIEAPLTRAYAQASIDSAKTLSSFLTKSPEGVAFQTKLDIASIEIRKQEITSIRDLKNSIDLDRISREQLAIDERLKTERSDTRIEELNRQKLGLDQQRRAVLGDKSLGKGEVVSPEAAQMMANQVGYRTQLAQLNSQQQQIVMSGIVKQIEAGYGQAKEVLQRELEKLSADNKRFFESSEFLGLSPAEQDRERARRQASEVAAQGRISDLGPLQAQAVAISIQDQAKTSNLSAKDKNQLMRLARSDQELAESQLNAARTNRDILAETVALESNRTITTKEILSNMEKATEAENNRLRNVELGMNQTQGLLAAEKEFLDVKKSQGLVTDEEYLNLTRQLETKQISAEFDKKNFELEKQRNQELEALQKRMVELGPDADEKELERLSRLKGSTDEYYNKALLNEKQLYDLKMRTKDLNDSLSARQLAYADVFKKTFDGMADALVTFVQTGKLEFKGLIDSMLADLIRYELRAQMSALYKALGGGSGIFAMLTGTPAFAIPGSSSFVGPMPQAKGGAWDYGVQKFAMGGTFTNQIVDSPTLFKFAQGTGMMGEAGPEAIMPLKRDANGNLGVRAQQQQPTVDVVVNNYGTAQATTQETTDSRGNRRIEVTIGEMSAGDLNRSGSASQRSLRSTYGLQPQLIRR